MSPFYPSDYTNWTTCDWSVTVPQGNRIRIEFVTFDLEDGFDYLRIDESQFSAGSPSSFISEDESVNIVFTSDGFSSRRGFLLNLSPISVSGLICVKVLKIQTYKQTTNDRINK